MSDYVRQPAFGATTGVANTYVLTTDPALPALVDGVSAYLDINVANTGASTLNWSGKGAKAIVTAKGAALTAGKLPLNGIVGVRYNASTENFILLGEGGEYGTAGAAQVLNTHTLGTENGVIPGTMTNCAGSGYDLSTYYKGIAGAPAHYIQLKPSIAGYYDTNSYLQINSPQLQPQNIVDGVNIFDVVGTNTNKK